MSEGELDMVTKAAKKGAMEGASVVAALKAPPMTGQDNSLMLEIFDKFRNDSKETVDKFCDDSKSVINKMLDLSKTLVKRPRNKRKCRNSFCSEESSSGESSSRSDEGDEGEEVEEEVVVKKSKKQKSKKKRTKVRH
jgi:hypothetical protein